MSDAPKRRPIVSRNTRWAQAISRSLARWKVSPNAISLLGMVAAILAGLAFWQTATVDENLQRLLWGGGAILCQVRLLCNLFDGMVAIEQGVASRRGELFNEVPDRVSDVAICVGLGYATTGQITLGYVAALLAIFVAYVRAVAKSIGAPEDFCGPMAKPQRMALVTLFATYLALSPIAWRSNWGEVRVLLTLIIVGCIVTASRRLIRANRYLNDDDF